MAEKNKKTFKMPHICDHDGHHPVRNLTDLDHSGRTVCACGKRRRSKGSRPEPVLLY